MENYGFEDRHQAFQFGKNPMKMTPYEKSKVELEKAERRMAHDKYVLGVQGRDGGVCVDMDDGTPLA